MENVRPRGATSEVAGGEGGELLAKVTRMVLWILEHSSGF